MEHGFSPMHENAMQCLVTVIQFNLDKVKQIDPVKTLHDVEGFTWMLEAKQWGYFYRDRIAL